jgi:hypothetical protein
VFHASRSFSFSILLSFKIDFFLWTWQNASGKAETNIVLIRFFITAAYALKAASSSELDIDDNTSATNP